MVLLLTRAKMTKAARAAREMNASRQLSISKEQPPSVRRDDSPGARKDRVRRVPIVLPDEVDRGGPIEDWVAAGDVDFEGAMAVIVNHVRALLRFRGERAVETGGLLALDTAVIAEGD